MFKKIKTEYLQKENDKSKHHQTSINDGAICNNNMTNTNTTKSTTPKPTTAKLNGHTEQNSLESLALLQSLTTSSATAGAMAAAAASAFNLKTLLIKKEKQLSLDSQFKPINSKQSDENNEDYDEDEEDLNESNQLKLAHSSSSSCTSPNPLQSYEPINTADIAQKVRDLLSVHNIGQRVFAKFILGLSQGTVSELLSKPKHWDKLTEKGRESYRKMFTWSCSEQSINKLKAISPRKGNKDNYFYHQNVTSTPTSNNSAKEDSAATEERIAQILNEAQKQMKASSLKVRNECSSPSGSSSARSVSSSAASPLMSPAMFSNNNKNNTIGLDIKTSQFKPLLLNKTQSDESDESDDDYDQKKKRFSDDPLDLTVKTNLKSLNKKIKLENDFYSIKPNNSTSDSENNMINSRKMSLNQSKQQIAGSPLKNIQSIAEQYLIQSHDFKQQSPNSCSFQRPSSTPSPSLSINSNNTSLTSSKPLKCVLPPVSQDQFDKYSFINTEELVKKVKDLLSKFSISQRLFGECILGLSQGSVSDLLARPKPWMMLTQKGREPFIRMQMFIDDPDAIKKLMANQYKTPSDKLTRTNSVGSVQLKDEQKLAYLSHNQMYLNNLVNTNNIQNNVNHSSASSTSSTNSSSSFQNNYNQNQHLNENSNDSELKQTYQAQINIIPYDISTLSSVGDLNTEEITNRVKETLLNNNIGQKLFGEAVLNLSQGTVSELLSKPKPWNTLSIKGREPYLRMFMWLNDSLRLEKLNEWKEEKNLLKRNNTEVESDHQKPKRRFIFSEEQKDQLMKAFKFDPYPAVNQMESLASKLQLQTRTVINWFHNHRMRIRYKNSTSNNQQQQQQAASLNYSVRNSRNSQQFSSDQFNQSFQYFTNSNNTNNKNSMFTNMNTNYDENNNEEDNRVSYEDEEEEEDDFNSDSSKKKEQYDNEDMNQTDEDEDEDSVQKQNLQYLEQLKKNAALLSLVSQYGNLPMLLQNTANKFKVDNNKLMNQPEDDEEENEEEEEEDENDSSSVQNDVSIDQEAEINSMYIPGEINDENDDNEYWNNDSQKNYSNFQSNKSNKRRKPHNPQKLNLALNLLQNKNQIKTSSCSNEANDFKQVDSS